MDKKTQDSSEVSIRNSETVKNDNSNILVLMFEKYKVLLENNLILETDKKLLGLEIYNKAFKDLDKNIKKIINDNNESLDELINEQNKIITALSML